MNQHYTSWNRLQISLNHTYIPISDIFNILYQICMLFNQICFSNKNIFDLIEFNIFLLIYRMNISNIYFNETNINISLNSLYISIKLTTTLLNRKYIPPNQQYTWNRKYILLKQTYTFSLNQQYICMHQRYIF